jgi:hypothetical protein
LCGNISLGCTSSSVTVSRIPNRGRTAIFVAASGEQCLERCQEHVVLHRVRIGEVADSIHRILLICANEAASLNKLRQLSSSIIYTSLFGIFTPHNLIANDALRDVAPRLWECFFFYFQNAIRCHGTCIIVVSLRRFSRYKRSVALCADLLYRLLPKPGDNFGTRGETSLNAP